MATEGPLTQMARALQARDQQFQSRLTNAMYMVATNPAGALNEFAWAEQEYPAIDQQRVALDAAFDNFRTQAGIAMTPQEAGMRSDMATMWHNAWFQVQCGKAQALIALQRLQEARSVIDYAMTKLVPQTAPQARSMLLQLRASVIMAGTNPIA